MYGISQFSSKFLNKSPFKNVEEPAKPEISDAERTGISDKEHHAISSNTDANSVMIAVDKDGKLVDDFMFQEGLNSLHVLNAPSPAATACLAIGEHIASKVLR